MNVIYIEGCQRSGNHILVQWMTQLMPSSLHMDNVCYNYEEQFDNGFTALKSQTVEEGAVCIQQASRDIDMTHLMISTEHPGLLTCEEIDIIIGSDPRINKISKLSLLRDPINWMASYAKLRAGYKRYGIQNQHGAKKSHIYSNYTMCHEEYWGRWYRSYLRWKETPPEYQVNYNNFISDERYRESLAKNLDLTWSKEADEKSLSNEAKHGSSFSKKDLSSTYLNRFNYMIPMFMAHPLPYHIVKAAQDDFPAVYEAYEHAMITADLQF